MVDDFDDLFGDRPSGPLGAPPSADSASPQALPAQIKTSALAALLGVSATRVRGLATDGILVRGRRGHLMFEESVRRYCANLREHAGRAGRPSSSGSTELAAEKLRLTKAQADREESRVAKERGELVPAIEVKREWAGILRDLRSALLAIPSRCGATLPHLTATDISTMEREIRLALEALGNGN